MTCGKTLRLLEHGNYTDLGKLAHSKCGAAQTLGEWPKWSKGCTVRASEIWVWLEELEDWQRTG